MDSNQLKRNGVVSGYHRRDYYGTMSALGQGHLCNKMLLPEFYKKTRRGRTCQSLLGANGASPLRCQQNAPLITPFLSESKGSCLWRMAAGSVFFCSTKNCKAGRFCHHVAESQVINQDGIATPCFSGFTIDKPAVSRFPVSHQTADGT